MKHIGLIFIFLFTSCLVAQEHFDVKNIRTDSLGINCTRIPGFDFQLGGNRFQLLRRQDGSIFNGDTTSSTYSAWKGGAYTSWRAALINVKQGGGDWFGGMMNIYELDTLGSYFPYGGLNGLNIKAASGTQTQDVLALYNAVDIGLNGTAAFSAGKGAIPTYSRINILYNNSATIPKIVGNSFFINVESGATGGVTTVYGFTADLTGIANYASGKITNFNTFYSPNFTGNEITNYWHFYGAGDHPSYFGGSLTAKRFYISALNTAPASASDTGTAGEMRICSDGIYICIATNTWIKCTGSTF